MSLATRLRSLFEGAFRRSRMEAGMDEELRFHRERYAADLMRSGIPEHDAELRARREFGAIEPLKEECRQARGLRMLDEAAQDLRYAVRSFRRSPGFTFAAILTLALGFGANTALFTLLDRAMLRPLPYPDPGRLVVVSSTDLKAGGRESSSPADLVDWRSELPAFQSICGWNRAAITLTGWGDAEPVPGVVANFDFLGMLGVEPQLGRGFRAQDETPGAPRVAIIGAGLWRHHFGSNPDVIGQTVQVNGVATTIVGVLPETFHLTLTGNTEIWLPLVLKPADRADRRTLRFNVIARIRKEYSLAQARKSFEAAAARLAVAYPATNRNRGVAVRTLRDEIISTTSGENVATIFGLVSCVLLIACFNVANLQLGRAVARQKEIAVRLGIGAGRMRLIRQLLTENMALFLAGAAVSVGIAVCMSRWLANSIPPIIRPTLPDRGNFHVDGRALVYLLAIGIAAGLIFGLAPALQFRKLDVARGLKESAFRAAGGRVRSALVLAEIALAMIVLVSAGLLIGGLVRMSGAAPGFDPGGVTAANVYLTQPKLRQPAARAAFFDAVTAQLDATPGVESASAATLVPFFSEGDSFRYRVIGGPLDSSHVAAFSSIAPAFFHTLRIPLLQGRTFSDADTSDAPLVAVINQAMADREWRGRNPVGERFAIGPDFTRLFTVIGVAGNTQGQNESDIFEPQIYASHRQFPATGMVLLVRMASRGRNAAAEIRRAVRTVDPMQAVALTMTMEQAITATRASFVIVGQMTACFAVVAILLAATGIYGVTAYAVNARRREFGIRMALGAGRRHVVAIVLRRWLALAAGGMAIGISGALLATKLLSSLLYHVKPTDPPTFIATAAFLAAIAAAASYIPARRAANADPAQVLRDE